MNPVDSLLLTTTRTCMLPAFRQILSDSPGPMRRKVWAVVAVLVGINLGVWALALVVFHQFPLLLGTALLAYSFGLRHAIDADHIAAIDNVTRALVQQGRKPLLIGFWFSLGHSTIVVALSLLVALTTVAIQSHFAAWKEIGSTIGTLVSAVVLLLIAVVNLVILRDVVRAFVALRRGEAHARQHGHTHVHPTVATLPGGLVTRLVRPLFRLIRSSWHMYPLGLLFGLGFDTATEVGVLGISASQATQGLPIWSILVFPALFTAGMALVDTIDGALMLGVYGWAEIKPIRKLYYNITITALSVVMAALIGGIEVLGLLADQLGLVGGFWSFIGDLGEHFGLLGYGIIGLFVLGWLVSAVIYRVKGYDDGGIETPGDVG